jgi:glycosyltransferase involved in cell wall biosynthesis
MHRKGIAASQLARKADHIVCGNQFLAEYFEQYNRPVTVIPTPVDTERFVPSPAEHTFIGWSGGSSGFKYLYAIERALKIILKANPKWKLLIVADKQPQFSILPSEQVVFEPWSPQTEVESIQKMTIGIMPLEDSPWTRGKCSYKMLLYMACAIPVVVSDVGMNADLLREAEIGLGVNSLSEWAEALQATIDNFSNRRIFGEQGRALVEKKYSLHTCSAHWLSLLHSGMD